MTYWNVEPNAVGGWDVRRFDAREPSFRTSQRAAAEAWARLTGPPGSEILVLDSVGHPLAQYPAPGEEAAPPQVPQSVDGLHRDSIAALFDRPTSSPNPAAAKENEPVANAAPTPAGPSPETHQHASPLEQFKKEGEWWDKGLAGLALLGAPLLAAFASPEVQQAAADGWWAVFVATLTWSLGCALSTFFLMTQQVYGMNAVIVAAGCMLLAFGFATWLGVGVLDLRTGWVESGHPAVRVVATFFLAALHTYGLIGTLLGGFLGAWLGYCAAHLYLPAQ